MYANKSHAKYFIEISNKFEYIQVNLSMLGINLIQ